MPLTIWAAMRAGSPIPLGRPRRPMRFETSVSSAAPRQMRMLVRRPAGFPDELALEADDPAEEYRERELDEEVEAQDARDL